MDRTLAEHYNTQESLGVLGGGYTGEDLQKQAAAEFLVKLAAEEGVDLNSLSDNEVGQLLAEVEGGMSGQTKTASAEEAEMQEKLAEADFLGRTMAHAYVNELAEIEKQAGIAGKVLEGLKGGAKRVGEWTGITGLHQSHKALKGVGKEMENLKAGIRTLAAKGDKGTQSMRSLGKEIGTTRKAQKGLQDVRSGYAKRVAKRVGLPLAAITAGGITTQQLLKDRGGERTVQAFDEQFEAAALERAQQMLAEAGYEKQAEDIGSQVEERALQMLEEAGYPVEWNQ